MKRKVVSLFLVLLFLLTSCAMLQPQLDTADKKYLAARMEFNKTMESYLVHKKMLPPEEQIALSAKCKPYFQQVDMALDAWEVIVLGEPGNIYESEQAFLDAKRALITLLVAEGAIKIEQ